MAKFTEEMMRAFSEEAIPVMEKLEGIARKFGVADGLSVWCSENYMSVNGSGLDGWELYKTNGRCRMSYNKTVVLKDDNAECMEKGNNPKNI